MGKYDNVQKIKGLSVRDQVLCAIANELAEANRLKRIEITILGANLDIPKTFSEAREDRA